MFFVVVRVSVGVIIVVIGGGMGRELVLLLVVCEEELWEFVVGMTGKLLDGGELLVEEV
jgi:hypothetical protein